MSSRCRTSRDGEPDLRRFPRRRGRAYAAQGYEMLAVGGRPDGQSAARLPADGRARIGRRGHGAGPQSTTRASRCCTSSACPSSFTGAPGADGLQLARHQQPPRVRARHRVPARPRPPPDRADQRAGNGFRPAAATAMRRRLRAARGLPADPALIRRRDDREGYGYRHRARPCWTGPEPPTAFCVLDRSSAIGVRARHRRGAG
jgi:hypothetical protein